MGVCEQPCRTLAHCNQPADRRTGHCIYSRVKSDSWMSGGGLQGEDVLQTEGNHLAMEVKKKNKKKKTNCFLLSFVLQLAA